MRALTRSALACAVALSAAWPAGAGAAEPGAAVFARVCAVCHGPQGDGIPGSFPPLHEQVTAFAKTPDGRDYLVMVVSAGLIGELPVGGLTYRGVMPPQSALSDEEVAAALSYVASGLGKLKPAPRAFSVKEVGEVRARHPGASGQTVRALRPAAATP
jgi:mono/diheme cytochrome c family protein